ncbi:MAG: hypothetical protein KatS3mg031_0201 [Chitinophagales bacterium]|nr:MAG: hypothetical protein KatS3mg031_0201 [Chitinophagales bacterium]
MNATATPALTLTPHVSLYALRQHPDFAAAKAGDISAALRLINDLLNPALLPLYTADAILAPVISEELSGFNAIPLALAIHLERQRGGIISTKILAHKAFHSNKNAMQRLLSPVLYAGPVQPHKDYIIIDDVVTTGSTLNDFKNYIHRHGGNVIAAICLVTAIHPVLGRTTYLSVTPKTLSRLLAKFGDDFPTFVKRSIWL